MPKDSKITPLIWLIVAMMLLGVTDHLADQAEAKQAERTRDAVYNITNRGPKR